MIQSASLNEMLYKKRIKVLYIMLSRNISLKNVHDIRIRYVSKKPNAFLVLLKYTGQRLFSTLSNI